MPRARGGPRLPLRTPCAASAACSRASEVSPLKRRSFFSVFARLERSSARASCITSELARSCSAVTAAFCFSVARAASNQPISSLARASLRCARKRSSASAAWRATSRSSRSSLPCATASATFKATTSCADLSAAAFATEAVCLVASSSRAASP
eukprot:scaffold13672_cov28-Tisochrysis_lutea.AAC.3